MIVKTRYPGIIRVIITPTKYPIEVFILMNFVVHIMIIVFIYYDLITIQKCNGIYKDFVRINHWFIKTL